MVPRVGNSVQQIRGQPRRLGHLYCVQDRRCNVGSVALTNISSRKSTPVISTSPQPRITIKGHSAEWIMEDPTYGGNLAPFADYGATLRQQRAPNQRSYPRKRPFQCKACHHGPSRREDVQGGQRKPRGAHGLRLR